MFDDYCHKNVSLKTPAECGPECQWIHDDISNFLYFYGNGHMNNFTSAATNRPPWANYSRSIYSIKIEDGLESIGDYCFNAFGNLTVFELGNTIKMTGIYCFQGDPKLTYVTLPDSLVNMQMYCFSNCGAIKTMHFGKNLVYIGIVALDGTHSLEQITCHPENPIITVVDGVLFNKEMTDIIQFPARDPRVEYTIPDGITVIKDSAFEAVAFLKTINIPSTVKIIEVYAFYVTKVLEVLTIPTSAQDIRAHAFCGSPNFVSIIWKGTEPPKSCAKEGDKQINQTTVSVPMNYTGDIWCGYPVKKIL